MAVPGEAAPSGWQRDAPGGWPGACDRVERRRWELWVRASTAKLGRTEGTTNATAGGGEEVCVQ